MKKSLVDQDKLILTQDDLECELFSLLKEYNYGQEVIHLYKKFYTLHLKKVPMIILVTGPPGLEKPQIAATLADRLNLSITLKTEVVLELLSCMNSQPQMDPKFNDELSQKDTRRISQIPSVLALDPLSQREPDWKSQFLQECQDTLVAMKADILKHIQEGKSFIIEGIHISNDLVSFIHDALDKFSTQKNGIPQSKHAIVASYRLSLENPQLHKEKLAHQLSVLHALSQEASETLVENNIFQKVQQLDRWYEQNLSSNFVTFRAEDHLISQAVQYIHEHFLCLVHNFS